MRPGRPSNSDGCKAADLHGHVTEAFQALQTGVIGLRRLRFSRVDHGHCRMMTRPQTPQMQVDDLFALGLQSGTYLGGQFSGGVHIEER